MIASVNGKIIYKSPELRKDSYFIVECGGVGYKIYTPITNLRRVHEQDSVMVFTYFGFFYLPVSIAHGLAAGTPMALA